MRAAFNVASFAVQFTDTGTATRAGSESSYAIKVSMSADARNCLF